MTDLDNAARDAEAQRAIAAGAEARSLSDDPLIASSLSVVDAFTIDVNKATENQRWAIRVAHRHGASLRQLAEVSGLHRNTISKIVTPDDSAVAS